jgi:hypothetical protein
MHAWVGRWVNGCAEAGRKVGGGVCTRMGMRGQTYALVGRLRDTGYARQEDRGEHDTTASWRGPMWAYLRVCIRGGWVSGQRGGGCMYAWVGRGEVGM